MTIWFVVQKDKKGRCLGVRSMNFQREEAEMDLCMANQEFAKEIETTGWPIWKIVSRRMKKL